MIRAADRDDDPNSSNYELNHMFAAQDDEGKNHWMEELPPTVVALIREVERDDPESPEGSGAAKDRD